MKLHYSDDVRKIIGKPGVVKKFYNRLVSSERTFGYRYWQILLGKILLVAVAVIILVLFVIFVL